MLEEPHARDEVESQPGTAATQLEDVAVVQGHLLHRCAGEEGVLSRAAIAEDDSIALAHDLHVERRSPRHEDVDCWP